MSILRAESAGPKLKGTSLDDGELWRSISGVTKH